LYYIAGIDVMHIDYVLHMVHSQAMYEFDKTSGRYSVRMALSHPQAGTDWVRMALKFMCKNSCDEGMNRRPTEIIFTLENERYCELPSVSVSLQVYIYFFVSLLQHFIPLFCDIPLATKSFHFFCQELF
jgi:hypothetical protein